MRIDVLTLFPEMFDGVLNTSMLGRARESRILDIRLHNIRDWSANKHRNADDYPFGGGAGMVMLAQPIWDCLDEIDPDHSAHRIALLPRGKTLHAGLAKELSKKDRLLLLCGHYEGVDERALSRMDVEVSIGDYVLTGGELPAMVLIDCLSRFIPGVLGSALSAEEESFAEGLLEYPQYTRPASFKGLNVPDVLLNGNHAHIDRWRRDMSLKLTWERRPELLERADLDKHDLAFLQSLKNTQN